MTAKKMNHPNQGVRCEVNTCHFYMSGDYCSADQIEVHPKNARDSEQTDCATFIPEGT